MYLKYLFSSSNRHCSATYWLLCSYDHYLLLTSPPYFTLLYSIHEKNKSANNSMVVNVCWSPISHTYLIPLSLTAKQWLAAVRKTLLPATMHHWARKARRTTIQWSGETLNHCSSCRSKSESDMRWTDTKWYKWKVWVEVNHMHCTDSVQQRDSNESVMRLHRLTATFCLGQEQPIALLICNNLLRLFCKSKRFFLQYVCAFFSRFG